MLSLVLPLVSYSQSGSVPTDLNSTAPLTITENQPIGTFVGEFNATDPDVNNTLTYSLVTGAGDTQNYLFTLDTNGTLKSAAMFDYESNSSTYSIRVQVKDDANTSLQQSFNIALLNQNDIPYNNSSISSIIDAMAQSGNTEIFVNSFGSDLELNSSITIPTGLDLIFQTDENIFINHEIVLEGNQKITFNAGKSIYVNRKIDASTPSSQIAFEFGQNSKTTDSASGFYRIAAPVDISEGLNFFTQKGWDGNITTYQVITALGARRSNTGIDLQGMKGKPTGNYALGKDIDANNTHGWDLDTNNKGFRPVSNFSGRLEGLGHIISNLFSESDTGSRGLFHPAVNAHIANTGLENITMKGRDNVGGFIGYNNGSIIVNCFVTGSVQGRNNVAGIIASNSNGQGKVLFSYSHTNATGTHGVGSLVGRTDANKIEIQNSFSTGKIIGGNWSGALMGGDSHGTVINSFWDVNSSSFNTSKGGTPKNTLEMQTASTYTDAGFNFSQKTGSWKILEGLTYPIFRWQTYPSLSTPLTDANFQNAINLWFSDEANATATFGHISDWNTSAVTDMSRTFWYKSTFNEDISRWDVSAVTDMNGMFFMAGAFNQPIGDWNVSSVTNMQEMFDGAGSFNQPIGNWDLSSVTNIRRMLRYVSAFNQPIGNWDVSAVTKMDGMFFMAGAFNQPIGDWNVSSVTNMQEMFDGAGSFNQPIGNWDVKLVTNMHRLFRGTRSFDQDIGDWNVSGATTMAEMFVNNNAVSDSNKGLIHQSFSSNPNWPYDWRQYVVIDDSNFHNAINLWFDNQAEANATYGHISDWNTSAVTDMSSAFGGRTTFNEDIGNWNVSSVTNMRSMFSGASTFNQPLGDWNFSMLTDMKDLFRYASSFNQDLSDWNVTSATNMIGVFRDTHSLSNANKGLIHSSFSSNSNWPYDWREFVILDDSNFQSAVNLWFDNQAEANSTYGHISDWNTSAVTNMTQAFFFRSGFNEDISNWDTSSVTNMHRMFNGAHAFNQPIGNWDVSSVTNMREIFHMTSTFNQPIGDWNVSSVTNMYGVFHGANAFNQSISDWNISSAITMDRMFWDTDSLSNSNKGKIHAAFASNSNWPYDWREFVALDDSNFHTAINLWFDNQAEANATYGHISDWNTSAVTDMSNAFDGRATFNEDIGRWDVSNVRNMTMMFNEAEAFKQDIGNWDVSSVLHMYRIFRKAISFNQDIGDWDVSSVITLSAAFEHASSFDQDLSNWDTSSVTHLSAVFNNAVSFNHSVNDWDTSAALNMTNTFRNARSFNHGLSNWDTSRVTSMDQMFEGAFLFDQDLSDWNISSVTNMHNIFAATHALSNSNKGLIQQAFSTNSNWPYDWREFVALDDSNFHDAINLWFDNQAEANATYGHISDWKTSAVTNMSNAFKDRATFNEDISGWDVSSVRVMHMMFNGAINFNQPIGDWNVSKVSNMAHMFENAKAFNQPLEDWDVSGVESMFRMFAGASSFDSEIGLWVTSKTKSMQAMFNGATNFNKYIGDWNTSSVEHMKFMFYEASSFNQDIANWNTTAVTSMEAMFNGAKVFNQNIGGWDTSSTTSMKTMFHGAENFNQPLGQWDTANVTSMDLMFKYAYSFNQDISNWYTSKVTSMRAMFNGANKFNQNIGDWDTSEVTNMSYMFCEANSFNQDISPWNIESVINLDSLFKNNAIFDHDISTWVLNPQANISWIFHGSSGLSNFNKGKIHKSFSSNQNWPYDWAGYANAPPHSLSLSDSNFSENLPIGSIIGSFSAIDPDENSTLSFSLNDASGSNDHSLFHLEENGTLLTAGEFDYETNASAYYFMVRATDEYGAFAEGNFTLTLLDVNETIDLDPDHNQTVPSTDQNTTDPSVDHNTSDTGMIDNNSTLSIDNNGTVVEIDQNGSSPIDHNTTTPIPLPVPEYFRPLVRTGQANAITSDSAILLGIVLDDGNVTISERGFLLSTLPLPHPDRAGTQKLIANGNSSEFEITANQLEPDTTYFFRAYAINSIGMSLGTIQGFETSMKGIGPHWIDALPVSNAENWWSNPWLGNFYVAEDNGWIMHEDLGWLFVLGQPDQSIWLWKETFGWLWTNSETYPFLYSNHSSGWLFYHGQLDGTLLFYDYADSNWIILRK